MSCAAGNGAKSEGQDDNRRALGKTLQTHQHQLYPRHLWHGCLSEGVVALQDGLTRSGLTSQGKSDVSVVQKEEEPRINVFRQRGPSTQARGAHSSSARPESPFTLSLHEF